MTTKSDKDVRHVVAKKRPHKLSIDVKVIKKTFEDQVVESLQ